MQPAQVLVVAIKLHGHNGTWHTHGSLALIHHLHARALLQAQLPRQRAHGARAHHVSGLADHGGVLREATAAVQLAAGVCADTLQEVTGQLAIAAVLLDDAPVLGQRTGWTAALQHLCTQLGVHSNFRGLALNQLAIHTGALAQAQARIGLLVQAAFSLIAAVTVATSANLSLADLPKGTKGAGGLAITHTGSCRCFCLRIQDFGKFAAWFHEGRTVAAYQLWRRR